MLNGWVCYALCIMFMWVIWKSLRYFVVDELVHYIVQWWWLLHLPIPSPCHCGVTQSRDRRFVLNFIFTSTYQQR